MSTVRAGRKREHGVTALFVVLFSALLLSIITVSFISLMVREQQRSTDDEQSQSAYDAALAGVEDAKRVIVACRDGASQACAAMNATPRKCTTVIDAGINGDPLHPEEVLLQSTSTGDGSRLNQAYTCVIINTDSPDYLGALARDESVIVPLKAVSGFSRITLAWHSEEDATTSFLADNHPNLPPLGAWQANRPALLRVQLMQYSQGAVPSTDFDSATAPNARTIYLYPQTVGSNSMSFALDGRRAGSMESQPVRCTNGGFSPVSGYACEVTLDLPGTIANRTGYLRLTGLYAGTHFRVQLQDGTNTVNFDEVQPAVDVTGRANDLFRRVEARVEMASEGFPYPRATVDITNNFCKTLSVSSDANEYSAGSCNPTRVGD